MEIENKIERKRCCRCQNKYLATAEFFSVQNRKGKSGLTSQCKRCRSIMWKEQYEKNRSYHVKRAIESTKKRRTREDVREKERLYGREKMRSKLQSPIEREKHRLQVREWFRKNKDRANSLPSRSKSIRAHYANTRRSAKLQAIPAWVDFEKIKEIYKQARKLTVETGIKHEVDHIVPLRHKQACGLHVAENLRVITKFENCSKSNRLITIED